MVVIGGHLIDIIFKIAKVWGTNMCGSEARWAGEMDYSSMKRPNFWSLRSPRSPDIKQPRLTTSNPKDDGPLSRLGFGDAL